MALGPIEVLVIAFPGNQFNGNILPELERLIEAGTIAVVDGLLITKDADGSVSFVEFEEAGSNPDAAKLTDLMNQIESLISDEDVLELADGLEPDSSALMLVFEHTWSKTLRDEIVDSGGVLANNFRVPGRVVEELLGELESADD